jgi:hypothetical protein
MRHQVAAIVLAASVVGGIGTGIAAAVLGPDDWTRSGPRPTPSTSAAAVPDIEVRKPVLVMNDDGTATLSATLVNHMENAVEINSATNGRAEDLDAPPLLVYGNRLDVALQPDKPLRIGGVGDDYRLRVRDRVQVGSIVPVTITLSGHKHYERDLPSASFVAPVVARTADHATVANNGPNPEITVHDGVVVVVPGQAKAYVGGRFESTIEDMTEIRPTVTPRLGQELELLHQTATGGPAGFYAQRGTTPLGGPPYLDLDIPGDREYVRASDVKVGQTIEVTFRFPSGDVVGRFTVVQGNADGTIAS